MDLARVGGARRAYRAIAGAEGTVRTGPWAVAGDLLLIDEVLPEVGPDDLVVDLGCGARPYLTGFLRSEGYDAVGVDLPKPAWGDLDVRGDPPLALVGYDGDRLPLRSGCADLVVLFGVLEHVGLWHPPNEKYVVPEDRIRERRRAFLAEVDRVLSPDGILYVAKYPNQYGRDRLTGRLTAGYVHRDVERTRPDRLRRLLGERFEVVDLFATGLLPHRVPLSVDRPGVAAWYARVDRSLSNLPGLATVAQSFNAVARPLGDG